MICLTGDTHREFQRVELFCQKISSNKTDILIILGDAGINYYGEPYDRQLKEALARLPLTLFCLHGNHEQRPEKLPGYREVSWRGGKVYRQEEFPDLLFGKDGEIYELNGKRCLVIGGAYSVDKELRLAESWGYWPDEQPSAAIKNRVEQQLEANGWKVDIVLSHTCPLKYEPVEVFLSFVEQDGVDKSTELWLDGIEDKLSYDNWYCGHYHTEKTTDRLTFMFEDFRELT